MRGCRRHQPPDLACRVCTGRHARRAVRTILATNPRRLFSVEFEASLSPGGFSRWRRAVRNLVDHQRRECRWWREVSMLGYLGTDGRVRGIVSLDAITPEEFRDALRRWPVRLQRIDAAGLSDAIYAAVAPGVIASSGHGGYRGVRFTLKPQGSASQREPVPNALRIEGTDHAAWIEPMPVLV